MGVVECLVSLNFFFFFLFVVRGGCWETEKGREKVEVVGKGRAKS